MGRGGKVEETLALSVQLVETVLFGEEVGEEGGGDDEDDTLGLGDYDPLKLLVFQCRTWAFKVPSL